MRMQGKILIILLTACTAGVGSFYVTRSLEEKESIAQDTSMKNWLDLSEQQNRAVQKSTPDFHTTAGHLSENYQKERQKLVRLLKNPDSSDEQILDQIEDVIQANGKLFRRVVGFVLSVRPHLSTPQHRRLMNFCGNIINGQVNRQLYRGRNIPPDPTGQPPGRGLGPGQGMGRDQGTGRGQGMRRGQGMGRDQGVGREQRTGRGQGMGRGQTNQLRIRKRGNFSRRFELSDEQLQKIDQLDPDFEEQSFQLGRQLRLQHQQLALLLKNPDTPDDEVWEQMERLFRLRNRLDRRTARHILLIRPHLTAQQQKILISMCNW